MECTDEHSAKAVHLLLLAELWDLLPWQLQQLEAACVGDGSEDAGSSSGSSAGGSGDASSSGNERVDCLASSSSSGGGGLGDGGHGSGSGEGNTCPTTTTSSSSSSGSDSQSAMHPGSWWSAEVHLDMPLLPAHRGAASSKQAGSYSSSSSASSNMLPAVTLQRLQLVTCAMAQAQPGCIYSAALLLTMLLQRAGPGLRAEFLGSPWGSLMMHTLAEVWTKEDVQGAACGFVRPPLPCDAEEALGDFRCIVRGVRQKGVDLTAMPAATSSLLVLAWTHLEVQQQEQQQQQQEEEDTGFIQAGSGYPLATVAAVYGGDVYPLGKKGRSPYGAPVVYNPRVPGHV
jgi:hypothetical protein